MPAPATAPEPPDDARASGAAALPEAFPALYAPLLDRAGGILRRAPACLPLTPAGLVHEAYLRLADQPDLRFRNHDHLFALFTLVMRQVLADALRRRTAAKRGAAYVHVSVDDVPLPIPPAAFPKSALREALEGLSRHNARLGRVVNGRFFAGYTEAEIAALLDVSVRTVRRDWRAAREWLGANLSRAHAAP